MIFTGIQQVCPQSKSIEIVKNGKDYKGAHKFPLPCVWAYGTLNAGRYSIERETEIITSYFERAR